MDPIAITVATLVAKWAAEGFVKEAAKSTWTGLTKIYETVRNKFAGDDDSTTVLNRVEQKPASEGRIRELAEVIDARLKTDSVFANELAALVQEAKKDPASAGFVTQVMDNARVGKIVNIDTVHGDVHF